MRLVEGGGSGGGTWTRSRRCAFRAAMKASTKRCPSASIARTRRCCTRCKAVGTQEVLVAGTAAAALLAAVAVGTKEEARACATCGGYGGVRCIVCDGTGRETRIEGGKDEGKNTKADFFGVQPKPADECRACAGLGLVRCKACGGTGYDRKL